MNDPRLAGLGLHHLRALDVLLAERSVTRAAHRLAVTQSAVSHALRDVREALGDPLLVRGPGGMVPTPRALALEAPLRETLARLDRVLRGEPAFTPATATRRFTLVMGDSFTLTVLPGLLAIVREEAPGVDLDVLPAPGGRVLAALDDPAVDLAFDVGRLAPGAGFYTRVLTEDRFACVVRADHPAVGDTLDLDTFCRLPHALMSPQGEGRGLVDEALAALGRTRRVHLRIRYFLSAPLVVARSDLVLTAPLTLARTMAELAPLRVFDPPLPLPTFPVRAVWPARLHEEPAHQWLRGAVARAVARSAPGSAGG